LRLLGANAVIPEEFETAVEISARVLREYEVPRNLILDLVDRMREEHYEALREIELPPMSSTVPHLNVLEKMEIQSCWIRENSPAREKSLQALNLRATTGATLVAVRRAGTLLLNPGPDHCFQANDIAILMGDRSQVDRAVILLDPLLEAGRRKARGASNPL
jgi:CPA2 family monovalent cation:H+ antiporter-2